MKKIILLVLLTIVTIANAQTNFAPYQQFYAGEIPTISTICDINGDGLKDVVVADRNSGLIVLYNTTEVLSTSNYQNDISVSVYPNPTIVKK